jgi:integrase
MAHGSYLLRRDGRYFIQVRKSANWAKLSKQQMYRRSLQTSDVREARVAITPILNWIWQMNSLDLESASSFLYRFKDLMTGHLDFPVWDDPHELRARENLEREIVRIRKNIQDEMGLNAVLALCPGIEKTWKDFVCANVRYGQAQDAKHSSFAKTDMSVFKNTHQPTSTGQAPVFSEAASPQGVYQTAPPVNAEPVHESGFGTTNQASLEQTDEAQGEGWPASNGALIEGQRGSSEYKAPPTNIESVPPTGRALDAESPLSEPETNAVPPMHLPTNLKPKVQTSGLKLSDAMELCLAHHKKKKKNDRQRDVVQPVIDFMIWYFNDPDVLTLTPDAIKDFVKVLPMIPNRNGIPAPERHSFAGRYQYGQEIIEVDGEKVRRLTTLVRLTKSTIDGGHLVGIRSVFSYLEDKKLWPFETPVLSVDCDDLLSSLPRDAFEEEELLKIITMPLFVGCASIKNIWRPGKYFIQNGIYWGYLIAMMAGLRQSEIVKLDCSDVVERNGVWYFDLRPFDPKKGRVPLKELKEFKASGSARVVPIHPLLIELGLLDRKDELEALGSKRLFPDVHPLPRKNGGFRWGHKLTRSYQYLQTLLGFEREDVCLYSMRHSYADALDDLALADRLRNRIMGHQMTGTDKGYGRKSRLSPLQVELLAELQVGLAQRVAEPLLAAKAKADAGGLTVIKPWLTISTWAEMDQEHLRKNS